MKSSQSTSRRRASKGWTCAASRKPPRSDAAERTRTATVRPDCPTLAVIATNGDVLTDQPLAPLMEAHERSGALATVLLTSMISPFGIVDTEDADS